MENITTNLKFPSSISKNVQLTNSIVQSKPKCIVIALPGCSFSNEFLKSWTETLFVLFDRKYRVIISCEYSSFVPFSRMNTLGLDVGRGPNQKPFNGELDYDVWLTIDSDIIFKPQQVLELIENTEKYPIVSGLYMMKDMKHFACVREWDEEYFLKNRSFQFITPEDVKIYKEESKSDFMKVSYNGMGFFACRRGVIETIKYPYFYRELQTIKDKDGNTVMVDMCSEDVAFCKNLIDAGHSIYVNCNLHVGHEKNLII